MSATLPLPIMATPPSRLPVPLPRSSNAFSAAVPSSAPLCALAPTPPMPAPASTPSPSVSQAARRASAGSAHSSPHTTGDTACSSPRTKPAGRSRSNSQGSSSQGTNSPKSSRSRNTSHSAHSSSSSSSSSATTCFNDIDDLSASSDASRTTPALPMTPAPPPVSPLAQPPSSSGILRSLRRLLRPSSASSTLAKPGSPLVPVSEDDAHLPSMAKPAAKLLKPRAALPLSPPSSPSSPVHAPAPLLPLTGTSTARTSKAASSDSLVATHFETESIVEAGRIAEARSRAVPTISVNAPSPQSSFAMEESAIHDIRFTRGVPLRLHRPGTGSVTLVHLGVSPMTHMLTGIIAFESDALGSPPFTPDVRTVFCVHYGFDDVHSYPLVGSPLTPLDMLKPHTYLIPQATSTSAKICGSAKFAFPYQSVFIRDLYSALRAAGANTSLSNFLIDGLLSLFVDIYLVPTPKAAPSDTPITLAQIQLLTPIMSARFDAEFMAEKNPDVFDHSLLHVPGDG